MNNQDFDQILQMAANREQEAVEYYTEIKKQVTNKAIIAELEKIIGMEEGHYRRLESIRKKGIKSEEFSELARNVTDLKIADYTEKISPEATMGWQDLLNVAMHREELSQKLYNDLASKVNDEAVKSLFRTLASEEGAHKNYFEKIYDEEILTEN